MIILTTLGLGRKDAENHYETVRYEWIDREGHRHETTTSLFPSALVEWFPNYRLIVLATERAKKDRGNDVVKAIPSAELIDIPNGVSDDEFWQIFNKIAEAIPEREEVVLDITHGFRSIPMLGILSLSFLKVAKNVTIKNVLYGALEAKNAADIVPVFDLTPFLTVLDGANATARFLKTGDARGFEGLLSEDDTSPLHPVSKCLNGLSEAIFTGRTEKEEGVWNQTAQLLANLDGALQKEHFVGGTLPYRLLAERIKATYAPLQLPVDATPEKELQVTWELLRWYAANNHYVHAVTLAREWCVSVRCWKVGKDFNSIKDRREAENWLGAATTLMRSNEVTFHEEWQQLIKVSDIVQGLRNDVAHFKAERKVDTVRKAVKDLPQQLRQAVLPLGIVIGEESEE